MLKKVMHWLYSFSLIVLLIITLGFILVTPLDIVLQALSVEEAALKLLIIIAACATFVMVSIIYYFSRLYRSRVQFNRIPVASVYIPLEKNDLPRSVLTYILRTLRVCVGEIKVQAGPLANEKELFNYPGRMAPKYIQRRNIELGLQRDYFLLPEDHSYQDIIDSIGLKLRLDGLFANIYTVPPELTFREIFVSALPISIESSSVSEELSASVRRCILTYEKAKFGGQLLMLEEIVEFFVDLEKVVTHLYSAFPGALLLETQRNSGTKSIYLDYRSPLAFNKTNSVYRKSNSLFSGSVITGSNDLGMGWGFEPSSRTGSGDVLPFLPSSLNSDLQRTALERPSIYSQVESNFSLTSSVLRAPAANQSLGRPRSGPLRDYSNSAGRFYTNS